MKLCGKFIFCGGVFKQESFYKKKSWFEYQCQKEENWKNFSLQQKRKYVDELSRKIQHLLDCANNVRAYSSVQLSNLKDNLDFAHVRLSLLRGRDLEDAIVDITANKHHHALVPQMGKIYREWATGMGFTCFPLHEYSGDLHETSFLVRFGYGLLKGETGWHCFELPNLKEQIKVKVNVTYERIIKANDHGWKHQVYRKYHDHAYFLGYQQLERYIDSQSNNSIHFQTCATYYQKKAHFFGSKSIDENREKAKKVLSARIWRNSFPFPEKRFYNLRENRVISQNTLTKRLSLLEELWHQKMEKFWL